jgi:hypothetical protein
MFRAAAAVLALLTTLTHGEMTQPQLLRKLEGKNGMFLC